MFFLGLGGLGLPAGEQTKRYCDSCQQLLNGGLIFLAFIGIGSSLIFLFAWLARN
jgi:hypothetical protein